MRFSFCFQIQDHFRINHSIDLSTKQFSLRLNPQKGFVLKCFLKTLINFLTKRFSIKLKLSFGTINANGLEHEKLRVWKRNFPLFKFMFFICFKYHIWLEISNFLCALLQFSGFSSNYYILFKFHPFQLVFTSQFSNPLWLEKSERFLGLLQFSFFSFPFSSVFTFQFSIPPFCSKSVRFNSKFCAIRFSFFTFQ